MTTNEDDEHEDVVLAEIGDAMCSRHRKFCLLKERVMTLAFLLAAGLELRKTTSSRCISRKRLSPLCRRIRIKNSLDLMAVAHVSLMGLFWLIL